MEVINSFFSNIKDKLTNPFFGTLIIVLLLHHWELIFGVFNFDKDCTLDDKIVFIEKYISTNITLNSFMWDAVQALMYMFLGYLIVVLTRSIVLWVEFWLMPLITGKIINKNVVRKSEYDDVVKEREQYFDQYEEQRENVRRFSKTIDEQTEQIKQKDKDLLKQSDTISKTVNILDLTKKNLESSNDENGSKSNQIKQLNNSLEGLQKDFDLKSEKIIGLEHLFFDKENQNFYSSIDKFPPEILNKVRELKKEGKWNAFMHLGSFYKNGGTIAGELVTEMIKRGLAFQRETREDLTPIGKIIYHYNKVFGKLNDDDALLLK